MNALEKKAIEAALRLVVKAQAELPAGADTNKTNTALTEARYWLEVFFVGEKNES